MPQFYFDIESEDGIVERLSASMPDLNTAKQYAANVARTIMGPNSTKPWTVSVKDENGAVSSVIKSDDE